MLSAGTEMPRCLNPTSLAAFEMAAGFPARAVRCRATGRCVSPHLCRAAGASPRSGEPAGAVLRTGAAMIVPLRPPGALRADGAANRVERRALSLDRLGAGCRRCSTIGWSCGCYRAAPRSSIRSGWCRWTGSVHLVDVGANDPASFSILIRGWRVPNAGMAPSREGMRIGEHPVRIERRARALISS